MNYRGRIAPTPSGYMHLGHAQTFWIADQRARSKQGTLVLRDEDLDRDRCRIEFAEQIIVDLKWLGIEWSEGPDKGGPFGPYRQSERLDWYLTVWRRLVKCGHIYPSPHSRRDVQSSLSAPHSTDSEPLFPVGLRPPMGTGVTERDPGNVNWRFRVPDGRHVAFVDLRCGIIQLIAGIDFGDFLVWRKDGFPTYELSVVADDHAMQVTEVVRGEDLLVSTARQILIYEALGWKIPEFFHCPLVKDAHGIRLAKRTNALALRTLREQGMSPEELIANFDKELNR